MIVVKYDYEDHAEFIMNFGTRRPAVFIDIDDAKKGLKKLGWKEEDFERFEFVEYKAICPHCGWPMIESDLPEYDFQCLHCDEDFYGFEVIRCPE